MNSPLFIAEDWPTRQVHAEDPYEQLWRELFHFAGSDAAKRAYEHAPDDTSFKRFKHAITIADEFIREFEDARELIDVVPFYYGTLWLGWAAAYATLGPIDLAAATPQHGLKCSISSPFSLLETTVSGVSRTGSASIINSAFGGEDLLEKQYSMLELLQVIPHLNEDLSSKANVRTKAYKFDLEENTARKMITDVNGKKLLQIVGKISVSQKISPEYLRDKIVAYEYLSKNKLKINGNEISWIPTRNEFEELHQICVKTPVNWYFHPKIRSRILPEFTVYLMILYVLSFLARYRPEIWIPMNNEQTDNVFIIRSFLHGAKRAIPRLVLNHITRKTNLFSVED